MRAFRAASGAVALVLFAALAGCFNDHGLAIEVDTSQLTSKAKQVELFVATKQCDGGGDTNVDCTQLEPQGLQTHLPGMIWFRDSDTRIMADVKDPSVSFRLEPDPKSSTTILFIYVVATDDNGVVGVAKLTKFPQPSNDAQILKVALTDAGPFGSTAQVHAKIWPTGTTAPPACLVVQSGTANGAPSYDFVVPQQDLDCDGLLQSDALECDANAYMAKNEVQSPNCITDKLTAACTVGEVPCTDGTASDLNQCVAITSPTPTCVPQMFCNVCQGFDPGCFLMHAENTTRLDCTVPTLADLQTKCDDQESGSFAMDVLQASDCDTSPQLGTIKRDDFNQTADVNGVTMAIAASGGPGNCAYKLTWQSGTFAPTSTQPHTVMRLQGHTHTLLIPIMFNFAFKGSGSAQGSCEITCKLTMDSQEKMFAECPDAPTTHP